ncbi:arabinogalactan [Babesia ovis]|uniref:Arabinogalactan n=1 Tax=Babesia ovis TaxID=5869 RepID=A0A9W5WVX7_BABOV|nr:arabinogalactan [Babesia ovis]
MAINPVLTQDVHSKQLLPMCDRGEYLLMYRPSTSFAITVGWRTMKGTGDTFLTTHRIVFVKQMGNKFSREFSSIALPFTHVDDPRFRQPIFGSNYLEGTIRPVTEAPAPLKETGKFYVYFDSGCGMFLKGFFMYYARVRNNPAFTVNAHPFSSQPESRSAFVDPSDPTHVYLTQPETVDSNGQPQGATEPNHQTGDGDDSNKRPGWLDGASQGTKTGTGAASVDDQTYLNGYTPDMVTMAGRYFMVETISILTDACGQPSTSEYLETHGLPGYTRWYSEAPAGIPAVYRAVGDIVTTRLPRVEVIYNDFRYIFGNGIGVTGNSVLLRMKCARCSSRGATLVVVNVDTGSKSVFSMDNYGSITKQTEANANYQSKCSSSLTGVGAILAALNSLSKLDNQIQDTLVLITDRNLPYAAGTRQFLDDYFGNAEFPWHSGWLHHAIALELGYGRCGTYELNYEGIDGYTPNLDVLTSFLSAAKHSDLDASPVSLWTRIGRMSANSRAHLPHVAMLPRTISSYTLTCARLAGPRDDNSGEKLLSTLTMVMRMHNNMDTVLERNANYYQMTSRESYVPASLYLLLIPCLLLGPTAELLYSGYLWDFHVLITALTVFIINVPMGSWLSYRYLVTAGSSGFENLDESSLSQVRLALVLLVLGCTVSLVLNLLLARLLGPRVFTSFVHGRSVLVRHELLEKLGYNVRPLTVLGRVSDKLRRLFSAVLVKVQAIMARFGSSGSNSPTMDAKKRLTPSRFSLLLERWRSRYRDRAPSAATSTASTDTSSSRRGSELEHRDFSTAEVQTESQNHLDAMGGTNMVCPTNSGLPAPNYLISLGTLFLSLVFLYSLMIFHWPLAVVLSLMLVPSLRRVRVWNHTRCKCCVDILVCGMYLLFMVLLSTTRNVLSPEQRRMVDRAFSKGPLASLNFIIHPLYNLYVSLRAYSVSDIISTIRSPFIAEKILELARQHVMLGSSTLPLIWFCAVPVVFHIVLIYTLGRFYKPAIRSQ